MTRRQLETIADRAIQRTLRRLPDAIRNAVLDCPIQVAWMEDKEADGGRDTDLLGLFEGAARGEPGHGSLDDLPCIHLFLDNLWDHSGRDSRRFREEVSVTLLHEIGHYLGMNEEQVAALGLA
jgi:predicted Zn-dependent protease with MMP-like domain